MAANRTTFILATIGAAALGYVAASAYRRIGSERPRGSAFNDRERFSAGDFSATRSAGPDAMRDPPSDWSRSDQGLDESFPASDPLPAGSRID